MVNSMPELDTFRHSEQKIIQIRQVESNALATINMTTTQSHTTTVCFINTDYY